MVGVLARVAEGWWRHLTRLFTGLPSSELLWIIDHQPDGTPYLGTDDYVRHPAGWLRHRFSFWLNPDGTRKPTPGEEAAERARIHRQQQAECRAEAARTAAAALPADRVAAEVMARRAAERPDGIPAPRPAAVLAADGTPGPGGIRVREAPGGWASLASLARELHDLKQAGQLSERPCGRRRHLGSPPCWPQDATEAPPSAEPPEAATVPTRSGGRGYHPTTEYEAAIAIAVASVAAWEAVQRPGTEDPGDQENAS